MNGANVSLANASSNEQHFPKYENRDLRILKNLDFVFFHQFFLLLPTFNILILHLNLKIL